MANPILCRGRRHFWLGRWSNDQSSGFINKQEEMRPATRQLASKATEIAIFGAAFLILMNIMGISLTSLAVLGARLVLGLALVCRRSHQTSSRA